MMFGITLHQMQCFDALVSLGSFQAAAEKVRRSQPSVSASVKNLEAQLGLQLLDRTGYRVVLTPAGQSFHARVRSFLHDFHTLENYAAQLTMGAESALTIVVGDVSPLPETLSLLKDFFEQVPETQLSLHFEAISGPCERLFNEAADLILHHIDKTDPRLEFIPLLRVDLVPVVAPNFLRFPISNSITPEQMRDYAQCVIRDTARNSPTRDYYLVEGARNWTVSDQLMKRELIRQGMGWGHMPRHLIAGDLRDGRLLPISGAHFPGGAVDIVAARRRHLPHGPVARRLWRFIGERAPELTQGS